jgi:hypothetical protein
LKAVSKSGYALVSSKEPLPVEKRKLTIEINSIQKSNSWESIFKTQFVEQNLIKTNTRRLQSQLPINAESLRQYRRLIWERLSIL